MNPAGTAAAAHPHPALPPTGATASSAPPRAVERGRPLWRWVVLVWLAGAVLLCPLILLVWILMKLLA
ncbi:MAG: hypothetical protein RI988_651 [Pseudomonadota bacterium]